MMVGSGPQCGQRGVPDHSWFLISGGRQQALGGSGVSLIRSTVMRVH